MDSKTPFVEVNCALCESSEKELVFKTKDGHFLSRCLNCGFQFYSPRPDSPQIEAYYHEEEFYEKTNITAVEIVMEILAHHNLRSGKLLDIGCGVGALVALAGKKGWEAVGMDPSPKAAALAKQVLDLDILQSYLGDSSFEPETFDVVVLLAVLEHSFDPVSIMKNVWKILKPGGWIIASTPNLDNISYYLMNNREEYSWFIKEHINHFTLKTHRLLLETVGFENPEFHMCGHFGIQKNGPIPQLLPSPTFARAARNMFSQSLDPAAQQMFGKDSAGLSDSELIAIMQKQVEQWDLQAGEYSLSDAVYLSAQKPVG
jgi:2-polyprenyl-3-methyl-5-hydroxy-6-metoxy-1,4-benzoquinol methylase